MADDELLRAIEADPRTRRRRWAVVAALVTAAGLGGLGLATSLARRATEQAKQRALDCVNAIYDSGEGDPADCRQGGAGLKLGLMLPWTREQASFTQTSTEQMVLRYQLLVASVRDLDIELRDRAARELVALRSRDGRPFATGSGPITDLHLAGAHALVVELASTEDSNYERKLALHAALLLGDWEAAGHIARTSSVDADDDDASGRSLAIVACILGDRATAAARLEEAVAAREHRTTDPMLDLRSIALHCELPQTLAEPREDYAVAALRRAAALYEPGAILGRHSFPENHELAMTIARMAVAQSEPIVWDKELREHDVELVDRIGLHDTIGLTPAVARTPDERPGAIGPVIVAELEAGARRLAELAAEAPVEHHFGRDSRTMRARESLIWGGYCLASIAAAERVWRGQLDEARAIHELVGELAATEELRKLGISHELRLLGQHAVLDPEAALRVADSVSADELAATDPVTQVMLRVQLALVYEQAGALDRALELAAGTVELLPRLSDQNLTSIELELGTRWIYGALLARAGRHASLEVSAPEQLRSGPTSAAQIFAYWWMAAFADPSAQAGYRWRAGGDSRLWMHVASWWLSSALELLARSGPADRRELWLDRVSADILEDPLDMIRARAAAAERLGDAAAVERWRKREAALLERLQDDRAAALYRLLR